MIKAFIFDMDGLLVETESIHIAAFEEFLRGKGISPPEGYTEGLVGFSIENNVETIKRDLGLTGDTMALAKERKALYLEMLAKSRLDVLPGVAEMVAFAEEKGLKKAVCSSSDREQLDIILPKVLSGLGKTQRVEEFFDVTVSGEGIEHLKPAPDIYLSCAAALGVGPEECVAFEDSLVGARSAVAAGMEVVVAPNPFSGGVREWPTRHVFRSLLAAVEDGLLERWR